MRHIAFTGIILMMLAITSCGGGSSGTLTGRVVDGFGNPLGGEFVRVTLTGNPAVTNPDRWGNFIVHAPIGDYTMKITFSNPDAGFNFHLDQPVQVTQGSHALGTFTLGGPFNEEAWIAYRDRQWAVAITLFTQQAEEARSGQMVFLPYYRIIEGEENENTLLTQGVLSAENGLGWCLARGLGDIDGAKIHYDAALSGGYNNIDAKVGLAGIALGEGNGQDALDLLDTVIDEPGLYDSSKVHDNVKEIDLMAAKALAQFLMGHDAYAQETLDGIEEQVTNAGNSGSKDTVALLNQFL
jgi:hypothetical protein